MLNIILPTLKFNVERWKYNKEFLVYVSNEGHFKDKYKRNLPLRTNKTGYLSVQTGSGFKSVHRLVMLTWRPIPNAEDLTIDHLDHNKRNNALTNLEWVSQSENLRRAREDFSDFTESEKEFLKRKFDEDGYCVPMIKKDKKGEVIHDSLNYLAKEGKTPSNCLFIFRKKIYTNPDLLYTDYMRDRHPNTSVSKEDFKKIVKDLYNGANKEPCFKLSRHTVYVARFYDNKN